MEQLTFIIIIILNEYHDHEVKQAAKLMIIIVFGKLKVDEEYSGWIPFSEMVFILSLVGLIVHLVFVYVMILLFLLKSRTMG